MTHVILKEFYHERQEPMFLNYAKQYTDMPFLILLDEFEGYKAGRFLRASDLGDITRMPSGSRWSSTRTPMKSRFRTERWGALGAG